MEVHPHRRANRNIAVFTQDVHGGAITRRRDRAKSTHGLSLTKNARAQRDIFRQFSRFFSEAA
jgi:hypothetical protein